ncbi:C69 family dipeptidase [Bifidobacterium dolichotidis]|nr:C69 family dipeptidase [Bifidobacterium dolichotidis]
MSCTTLLVGKSASFDGSTIIARDDDSGSGRYDPKHFVAISPSEQPREYRSVLSKFAITLPDNPCRYSIVPNVKPDRGVLAEAGVNEHNVAMSATETIAVNTRVLAADPLEKETGFGEEDIITLVLPYVSTAREGVKRLGSLLSEYGTYESNGVIISDVNDIWYVETIGGHHWMARRIPDDCYAAIPNQLSIDTLDFSDAYGEGRENLCSADFEDFVHEHHLDLMMDAKHAAGIGFSGSDSRVLDTRAALGTANAKDHIYNTPRAWYMQRYFNPTAVEQEGLGPESDGQAFCRVPERKITIEDVDFLLGSHFEGTEFDPYGTTGTAESRHRYRPIGVNRTGHMVAMQIRPNVPEAMAAIMWISFGSGPFTTAAPFYANVTGTPAYLRDTPADEVSTNSLYWSNRLIAALADGHWFETDGEIEQYIEDVQSYGLRHVEQHDIDMSREMGELATTEINMEAVRLQLEQANEQMAEFLQNRTKKLLFKVLYICSNMMNNAFKMSDKWI